MAASPLVGAIDVGGTKLAYGVFGEGPEPLAQARVGTVEVGGPDIALATTALGLRAMAEALGRPLAAVGIASAGPLDAAAGKLINPPNLGADWAGADLCGPLARALQVPVRLANDADAAALAEAKHGAGQGAESLLYVTWSTGVGGGWVLGGKAYGGWKGLAGEIGHLCVVPQGAPCGCGKRGCLEAEVSGSALARQVRMLACQAGLDGHFTQAPVASLHAGHLLDAAEEGLGAAVALRDRAIALMARGLGMAIHLMAPDRVVVGGGLMVQGDRLLPPLREALRPEVAYLDWPVEALVSARFTAEAPLVGAAQVAWASLAPQQPK